MREFMLVVNVGLVVANVGCMFYAPRYFWLNGFGILLNVWAIWLLR